MKKILKIFISSFTLLLICLIAIFFYYKNQASARFSTKNCYNFLILGLDPRDDRLEKTEVTDTIIFASLNLKTQSLKLFSLPRDLWHYPLETKINQIYPLSFDKPNQYEFIKDNFNLIIGQKIDNVLIITTQNLIDITSIIGGVDVSLEQGFTDNEYPNPEYLSDPSKPIYITVSYNQGLNHLNSANITPFIRSRKSADLATGGGTDLGRIQRQQLLINALSLKLKNISNNQASSYYNLYKYFAQNIKTDLDFETEFLLGLYLNKKILNININKVDIPTDTKDAIIYHPLKFINKQWVFITKDEDYSTLKTFIAKSIN